MLPVTSRRATKSGNFVYSAEGLDLIFTKPQPAGVAKDGSKRPEEEGGDQNLQPTPPTPPTRQGRDSSDKLSLEVVEDSQPTNRGSYVSAGSIQSGGG